MMRTKHILMLVIGFIILILLVSDKLILALAAFAICCGMAFSELLKEKQ
jgi:hypothetical protein